MKTTDKPKNLRPYLFHGVEITEDPTEATGACPFCGKEGHFNVKTATGQFRCVRCEESGNIPSFLAKLLEFSLEQTKLEDYTELVEDRGIPAFVMQAWRLCKSIITEEWIIPAYNNKGKLANLSRMVQVENDEGALKWKAFSTPTCKQWPFGTHLLNKNQKTRIVAEGPWDGMAFHAALTQVRSRTELEEHLTGKTNLVRTTNPFQSLFTKVGVLAAPGAGTFDPDWFPFVDDCPTLLPFDNDHPRQTPVGKTIKPGWDGQQRFIKLAKDSSLGPSKLFQIKWGEDGYNPDLADGYDFRDLYRDSGPVKGLTTLQSLLKRVKLTSTSPKEETQGTTEEIDPIECGSFNELIGAFKDNLHVTETFTDTLAIMLAVMVSTDLPEDQLLLRVKGPPGSGKSTLAECLSAAKEYALPLSVLTGFHSGFIGSRRGKMSKKDSSLIPLMNGKTTFIKDADTLLTAPNRDKILGELRDITDGVTRATYRTGRSNVYEGLRTTFILCGTDALNGLNRSFLGDRFLDCDILGAGDTTPYVDRAARNTYQSLLGYLSPKDQQPEDLDNVKAERQRILKGISVGFITHIKTNLTSLTPPQMTTGTETKLKAMGQLLASLRARKDRSEEMTYRPRVELPTRLASQFVKIAVCLALVLGKPRIDSEVLRIVRKVALDTATGFHLEIIDLLARYKAGGLDTNQIAKERQIPESSVRRILKEMQEFGLTTRNTLPNKSGQRGRDRHLWRLSNTLASLYKQALK